MQALNKDKINVCIWMWRRGRMKTQQDGGFALIRPKDTIQQFSRRQQIKRKTKNKTNTIAKHNGMRSLTWETPVGLKSHHLWANFSAVRAGKSQFARGTDGLHRSASHRHRGWCTHMFGQVGAFGVHVVPASEQAEGEQQSHFGNTGHWRVILTGNVQRDGSGCSNWTRIKSVRHHCVPWLNRDAG